MPLVSSGVEHGNLRELALARMKDMGTEVRLTLNSKNWCQLVFNKDANRPHQLGRDPNSRTVVAAKPQMLTVRIISIHCSDRI